MTLAAGTRLGPYAIQSLIGAGGMGEVYRARDARLGRDVAIKVLPPAASADHERRARFEREAKTIAGLNHPHICTLHDVGEYEASMYLVMELLEGESLRTRLAVGRQAVSSIVEMVIQLADALDCAHGKGTIHRDVKPENIFITTRGAAKLLDFGIAHLLTDQAAAETMVTATRIGTGPVALGTVAYMSPEQIRGEPLDARTDLFSLGVVLYEMATGQQPFRGTTFGAVLGEILANEPPEPATLNGDLPSELDRVIDKLLEKERELRYQSARDLFVDLQRMRRTLGEATRSAHRQGRRAEPLRIAQHHRGPARFSIMLPADAPLALDRGMLSFAVAPDGRRFVYVARIRSDTQLYIRESAEPIPRPIPGTEGARSPFFSPDGRWIGYIANGDLCKVAVSGALPTVICQAGWMIGGADWTDVGILFNGSFLAKPGIWLVDPDGGTPRLLVRGGPGDGPSWPQLLPGGRAILFSMLRPGTTYKARVEVFSLESRTIKTVVEGGAYHARYLESGHLLYAKAGQLFVAPFDVVNHVVTGDARPVLREAFIDEPIGWTANYCVSRDGLIAYLDRRGEGIERELMWIGLNGFAERLPAAPGSPLFPRLSPDGRLLAATIVRGDDYNIHVYDLQRGIWTRASREGHNDLPIWSPDGKSLTFTSDRGSRADEWHMFRARLDGTGLERLAEGRHEDGEGLNQLATSWNPNGDALLYLELPSGACRCASMQAGGWQTQSLVQVPGCAVFEARFSPDGQLVAYTVVDESTSHIDVYVAPFGQPGDAILVSKDGGMDPIWSPEGSRLFYRHGSSQVLAVPIRTTPALEAGAPELLFEGPVLGATWLDYRSYDMSRDGRRFIASGKLLEPRRLEVVLNWFEELDRARTR